VHSGNLDKNSWEVKLIMWVRSFDLRRSQVGKKEDWFEPVLNIHTTLTPTVIAIFLFAPFQLRSQNYYS